MNKFIALLTALTCFINSYSTGMPESALKLSASSEELQWLGFLYKSMNPADSANRSPEFFLENAVRPALKARMEMSWGKNIPDREFRYFVLPLRVNNEALDAHRQTFYDELRTRVNNLSMKQAILEINHWCHEKATYQPSDGRTHSPLQTVSAAIGRCGEESTFTVAALRAMGIPARQVYTPRWAHTDDNHAWVEAWADGQWHFLGACEPEPVLNLGWFNAPSTRGMLMHARVPGCDYDGPEEVLARMNGNTDINVTSNYAPVDTLSVTVLDRQGKPANGAKVSFRVYNYAEFYPVVTKITEQNGQVSIIGGLGDIIVWATDGKWFGFEKFRIGTDHNAQIRLDHDNKSTFSADINITPPIQGASQVYVTDSMRDENFRRFTREDSIRNAYTSTFASETSSAKLANDLNIDNAILWPLMQKSRGNHAVISKFLHSVPEESRYKAIKLLESISDKDLTDIPEEVLQDHIKAKDNGSEFFAPYIMSPRIAMEELTSFRSFFQTVFKAKDIRKFQSDPQTWVEYVNKQISATLDWYPSQATMSPEAVWSNKRTSAISRDIFFVAGARSFGIPARIDPITGKVQWADNNMIWHDAIFNTALREQKSAKTGELQLLFSPTRAVNDPKYYTHFTISKIKNGEPQLLNYPDFIPWSETFRNPMSLDCGQYLIVTGQRMADGSVLSHYDIITIDKGLAIDSMIVREDPSGIEVIGSFDAETHYKPIDKETEQSILSTTGRGYYVLGLVKSGHEPSNHAFRDLSEESSALETWNRPILLLFDSQESFDRMDMSMMPKLPKNVMFGIDNNGKILQSLMENLRISKTESPIFIIADTFNRVVFVSQGYTIGLGRRVSDTASQLE